MRLKPRHIALSGAVAAIFAVGACGHSSKDPNTIAVAQNAPSYCQQLAKVPVGLESAVAKTVTAVATDADKAIINTAASQLKNAAKDHSAPADVQGELKAAAAVLDKLVQGKSLTSTDLKNFSKLGGMVNDKCVR